MSKGKIIKPRNPSLPDNPLERNVYNIIQEVVPTFEIDVENEEWEKADEDIKEELKAIEEKVLSIASRLGSNEGNLTDELKKIKEDIESLKSRRPVDFSFYRTLSRLFKLA
jgi:predicted  nucleic acid-binding Zn-ribbon protein